MNCSVLIEKSQNTSEIFSIHQKCLKSIKNGKNIIIYLFWQILKIRFTEFKVQRLYCDFKSVNCLAQCKCQIVFMKSAPEVWQICKSANRKKIRQKKSEKEIRKGKIKEKRKIQKRKPILVGLDASSATIQSKFLTF